MASYIRTLPAADEYSDALTLGPDFSAKAVAFTIANNSAFFELATGVVGDWQWDAEGENTLIPQSNRFDNVVGIRFRNAVAGQVASVWAALIGPGDPDFGTGLPILGTQNADGSFSPPSGLVVYIIT